MGRPRGSTFSPTARAAAKTWPKMAHWIYVEKQITWAPKPKSSRHDSYTVQSGGLEKIVKKPYGCSIGS